MSIRNHTWQRHTQCCQGRASSRRRPFAKPTTKPRYSRDRIVDILHIRLELAIDYESKSIKGTCSTKLRPLNDGVRFIEFDSCELEIHNVSLQGDGPISFSQEEEKLRLDLGKELSQEEEICIVIRYSGKPRRGIYFIKPDEHYPNKRKQVWTQGQDEDARYWFPCYDYPNQKATSEVIASVPKGWFALSNGSLVSQRDDDKVSIFHWRHDIPHVSYLITLAAGEYVALEEKLGDLPVVAYVPPGDEEQGKRAFSHTKDMIELFEEHTGQKYPYAKYAQIVVEDFIFGGMENTSATTLTDLALHDAIAAKEHSSDPLVAHELAHQWFGDLLTCRDWSHAWLNEGFATYCEALWEEKCRGIDEMRYYLYETMSSYFTEDQEKYRRPIVSKQYKEPLDLFDRHLYEKGGLVLHMLRKVLGEKPFWNSIQHYVKENAQRTVITRDLLQAIEEATGKNMEWFFDQWIYAAGFPEYKVSYQWDPEEKIAQVTIKQTQKEEENTPVFQMPIQLSFVGETEHNFRVTVDKREHTFYFVLPEEPKDFRFDPENTIIKAVDLEKPKSMSLYQLKQDSDISGRILAAQTLGKQFTSETISALGDALENDAFWGVRVEVSSVLGKLGNQEAKSYLLKALSKESTPKVKRAILSALGEFRQDQEVSETLSRFVKESTDTYFARGEAAKSLGKIRTPKALEGISHALSQDSWADVIRVRALEGLGELRDEEGFAHAKEHSQYGKKPQGRAAAVQTLAKLAEEYPQRKSEVLDHFKTLVEKPGFRVHLALIAAMGKLKDPRAIPSLQKLSSKVLDGRIQREVENAIREIGEGNKVDDSLRTLRNQLEKLQEENRALQDRVNKIESKTSS